MSTPLLVSNKYLRRKPAQDRRGAALLFCLFVIFVVTLIFVGLTAVVYHQRAYAFQASQQVLRAQAQVTLAKDDHMVEAVPA